jgi:glucose-6-phosphate isomerase
MEVKKPQTRYLYDMKSVLYDQRWVKNASNRELYYMYRGKKRKGDLRYDITIIPAKMLGQEFNRTKGNRNSKSYQELYTVLEGRAIFLMQKIKRGQIDIIAVEARKGQSVVFPARYAAITINPGNKELKIANWV